MLLQCEEFEPIHLAACAQEAVENHAIDTSIHALELLLSNFTENFDSCHNSVPLSVIGRNLIQLAVMKNKEGVAKYDIGVLLEVIVSKIEDVICLQNLDSDWREGSGVQQWALLENTIGKV